MLCYVILHHTLSYRVILEYVILCCTMLSYVMLCYTVLYHVSLCICIFYDTTSQYVILVLYYIVLLLHYNYKASTIQYTTYGKQQNVFLCHRRIYYNI